MQAGIFMGAAKVLLRASGNTAPLSNQNQSKNHLSLQYSFGSDSGYAPMVLG